MSDLNRRRFLVATGAVGIAGLAGCSGGDGGDGGDGGGDGDDGGDGGSDSGDGDDGGNGGGDGGDGMDGDDGDDGTTTDDGGLESRTIELGTMMPVSGEFGSIGKTMQDATELAFNAVDDGSDALSIDVTFGDTQSGPQGAISAANNLANAGVPAVAGPGTSTNFLTTAQQVFIPSGIVMVGAGPTAVAITNLDDDDLAFRVSPSDAFQGRVMAQYAMDTLGVSTAATLAINDAYGQGLAQQFAQSFEEVGGTVQAEVAYESGQASYTSRISNAVEDDPGVLVFVGKGGSSSIQLLKDYYSDFDPERPILTVDGMNTARIPNEVGRPLENITGTAPLSRGPARDAFTKQYQDAYDREPGPFNGASFDASAVLLMANARAGENSGSAIKEQMRPVANQGEDAMIVTIDNLVEGVEAAARGDSVNYQGVSSPVEFDENGDIVAATYGIWEYAPDTESGFETIDEIEIGP